MERVVAKKYQLSRRGGRFTLEGREFLREVKTVRSEIERENAFWESTGKYYEIDNEKTIENNIQFEEDVKKRAALKEAKSIQNVNVIAEAIAEVVSKSKTTKKQN